MVRDKGINLKPGVYLLSGITRLWHEEAEGKLLSPCVICFIADGKTTMLRYYEKEKEQGKRAFCYMYGEMLLGQMKDGEIRRRFCNRCEKTFEFSRGDLLDNRKRIEDPEAARAALLPESVPDVSQLNTLGQILAEKLTGIRDFSVCPFCGSSGVTDLPAE